MKIFISFLILQIGGKVYEYHELDVKPRIIRRVEPVYPEKADGKEGYVVLKVLVDSTGKIVETLPILSTDSLFKKLALIAARAFIISPGMKEGKSVSSWIEIPFRFKPQRRENPIKRGKPDYGEERGEVYVLLNIDKNGRVKEATVFESSNSLLNKPALEAAKGFVFKKTSKGFWALLLFEFKGN
jgi:TonB family protein